MFSCDLSDDRGTSPFETQCNSKTIIKKESNILLSNATIKKIQEKVLFNTKGQYTKEESNTHAGSANLKQLQRGILLNTKKLHMKKSIICLVNANMGSKT